MQQGEEPGLRKKRFAASCLLRSLQPKDAQENTTAKLGADHRTKHPTDNGGGTKELNNYSI